MKVLALYSSKGGVGKSTASVNLGFYASESGLRTLLVDLDRVGSSSYFLQVAPKKSHSSNALLKGAKSFYKQIRHTDFPLLDVLPSSENYSQLVLLLDKKKHASDQLAKRFKTLHDSYDLVILDTPPTLDLIADNVLLASDLILIPILPSALSLLGMNEVKNKAADLQIDTAHIRYFVSQLDKRIGMQKAVVQELIQDEKCLHTIIPCSSAIQRMALLQDPIGVSDKRSTAAKAYKALYLEVAKILFASNKGETR